MSLTSFTRVISRTLCLPKIGRDRFILVPNKERACQLHTKVTQHTSIMFLSTLRPTQSSTANISNCFNWFNYTFHCASETLTLQKIWPPPNQTMMCPNMRNVTWKSNNGILRNKVYLMPTHALKDFPCITPFPKCCIRHLGCSFIDWFFTLGNNNFFLSWANTKTSMQDSPFSSSISVLQIYILPKH